MALTVAVSSTFEKLFQQNPLVEAELARTLYAPNETAEFFGGGRLQTTNKDYAVLAKADLAVQIQAFQKAFTANGSMDFIGIEHKLDHVKVDTTFSPDDLSESFYTFLEGLEENDRSKWPFARWYINVHLVPSVTQDKEIRLDYKGRRGSVTAGTAQILATTGFGSQINDWIAALLITPYTLVPSATPATFVDQLATFVKEVRDSSTEVKEMYYSGDFDYICMSPENHEKFIAGMDAAYNGAYQRVGNEILTTDAKMVVKNIPGTSVKTIGLRSMIGSDKIVMAPKWNRFGKIKSGGRLNKPLSGISDGGREVWVSMDWKSRVGHYLPAYVFTNNSDLAF